MVMRTLHPGWVYGTRRPLDFFFGPTSISISCPLLVLPAPTISGSLTERRFRPCRKGSPNSFTAHAPEISRRSDLSLLECAFTDKHRVLPVFTRSCQHSSPLETTLVSILVGVDSKWLTEKLSPLDATLTKNTGGRGAAFPRRSDIQTCGRSEDSSVPLQPNAFGATIRKGTRFLHDPRKQLRSPRCLRIVSGHREPFDGVPGYPDSVGVAS